MTCARPIGDARRRSWCGARRPARDLVVGITLLAGTLTRPQALAAQSQAQRPPRTLGLQLDNDAFNFWLRPWRRSDDEYTSGVRVLLGESPLPWWRNRVWSRLDRCRRAEDVCVTPLSWIGQDIYNPARDSHQEPRPDGRPNAGWLYLTQELRCVYPASTESVALTLGVTGPPALGETMQALAHSAAPALNRPIDWSRQIQFEPGIAVRYGRESMFLDDTSAVGVQLLRSGSVSAGNVLTEATGALRARVGVSLQRPWLPISNIARPEVAITGSLTGHLVAHDLFLDGNTFRRSPRVKRNPFVLEQQAGFSVRARRFQLGYDVHWLTATYRGGPAHIWSSMSGGLLITR